MSDERLEEHAALYALDLLEGTELAQFEAILTNDPHLRDVVAELRDTAAMLALTAPPVRPPASLKSRILATLAEPADTSDRTVRRHMFSAISFAPWAVAACFALLAAWAGQKFVTRSGEASILRERQAAAEIEIKAVRQLAEAERIVYSRKWKDFEQKITNSERDLADTRTVLLGRERTLAEQNRRLQETETRLVDRESQLAQARTELVTRERQMATLTQRIDALAGASSEIGRQLGEAKDRIAALSSELKKQGDLADFKITTLASMLKNSPQALAVAVWDPAKQEGVLKVEKLPALLANQDYQLWVVDPQYPNPVDGGVFNVDPQTGAAKLRFTAKQTVSAINAFAVTLERKGGVPKAEGPFVLLGK